MTVSPGLAPRTGLRPWEIDEARRRLRREAVHRMEAKVAVEDRRYPRNIDVLVLLADGTVGRVQTGVHGLVGARWRYGARQPWRRARARQHGGWLRVRVLSESRAKVGLIVQDNMGGAR